MEKTTRHNRIRETLDRIYDREPSHFQEYLRRYREDPTSRLFAPLAEAYRSMGRVDEAITLCENGLKHHPDFHSGRVALARCLMDKNEFEEAKAELEQVIQVSPENLLAQRLLGDCRLAVKDIEGALHAYKMALLLSPEDVVLSEKVHQLQSHQGKGDRLDALLQDWEVTPLDVPQSFVGSQPAVAQKLMDLPETPKNTEGCDSDEEILEAGEALIEANLWEDPVDEPSHPLIDSILGMDESGAPEASQAFRVEHISVAFKENKVSAKEELTSETLGDLYFSQEQFSMALRIFEKLYASQPSPQRLQKVNACRLKLGVDMDSIKRQRKIGVLKEILGRSRVESPVD